MDIKRKTIWILLSLAAAGLIAVGLFRAERTEESFHDISSWGQEGSGPGEFRQPFDIAIDQEGFVYVTDTGNRRVQKFSSEGKFIRQWGEDLFEKPAGITIGLDDAVYVSDYFKDEIFKFSRDGKLLLRWGKSGSDEGEFDAPVGVAVGSQEDVYVVDEYNHRVQKFTGNGKFLLAWGKRGKVNSILSAINFLLSEGQEEELYYPSRIAVGLDNLVYVADSYNNRVQVFSSNGRFVRKWGGMGIWGGRFRVASAIAFDPKGHVYVGDFYNNRIQKFTRGGNYLTQFEAKGDGGLGLKGPTGLAIDQDGNLYIVDFHHDRILKFHDNDPDISADAVNTSKIGVFGKDDRRGGDAE